MIIIGSKPISINLDEFIDTFERNIRFNLAIPGFNNGNKSSYHMLNIHCYHNFRVKKLPLEKLLEIYSPNDDKKFRGKTEIIEKSYDYIKKIPKEKIIVQNIRTNLPNAINVLNKINCPIKLDLRPRVGIDFILQLIRTNTFRKQNIPIVGFSIKDNVPSFYDKRESLDFERNIRLKNHNCDKEHDILIWLHNNNYIDATLCLLEKKEGNIYFNTNVIYPKKATIEKLRQYYENIIFDPEKVIN